MLKFLKLTEVGGNADNRVLILNAALIEHVAAGSKGKDTYIRCVDKGFFFVKESLEDIMAMLTTDYSKAPVIMTRELASSLGLAK